MNKTCQSNKRLLSSICPSCQLEYEISLLLYFGEEGLFCYLYIGTSPPKNSSFKYLLFKAGYFRHLIYCWWVKYFPIHQYLFCRYISEPLGLIRYLCEIHMTGILPSAIIIEDFFYYVTHHQVKFCFLLCIKLRMCMYVSLCKSMWFDWP